MKRGESEDSPQSYLYDIKSLGQRVDCGGNGFPCNLYALEGERKDGEEEDHMGRILPAETTASNGALIVAHFFSFVRCVKQLLELDA
jgi:hypothetical protein